MIVSRTLIGFDCIEFTVEAVSVQNVQEMSRAQRVLPPGGTAGSVLTAFGVFMISAPRLHIIGRALGVSGARPTGSTGSKIVGRIVSSGRSFILAPHRSRAMRPIG